MTEQELRTSITPCIMAGNTWFVFEQIKAYADAQVAANDTEIAQLKAELKWANDQLSGIKTDMQHSRLIEAAQVKEVAAKDAEINFVIHAVEPMPEVHIDKTKDKYSFLDFKYGRGKGKAKSQGYAQHFKR